ncbi:MAG: aminoglycoside 3'-phosphotransferase [Actinomycetota bacterium]
MIARRPPPDVELPIAVRRLIGGRSHRPLWRNELGGLTVAVDDERPVVVKWAPPAQRAELDAEVERLTWAAPFVRVPEVLDHGADDDTGGAWMLTALIEGESAVEDRWLADPEPAVRAVGAGLRTLHDSLPVADCPFGWSLADRRADAHRRAAAGLIDPARWHEDLADLSLADALALIDALDEDAADVVVCHGDACAPNTLVDEQGRSVAHVDLGRLGVADRWADLAIATWSTVWNHGPGWEGALLDAYGIDPDPDRIRGYRVLWELGP